MSAELLAVRVFARWADDPLECPFAFDLILDRETNQLAGAWPAFGATDLGDPKARPFVLDASGALNFGAEDRRWRTDLRDRQLTVGARFSVWWTDEDRADYEIVKVAVLGGKNHRRRAPP